MVKINLRIIVRAKSTDKALRVLRNVTFHNASNSKMINALIYDQQKQLIEVIYDLVYSDIERSLSVVRFLQDISEVSSKWCISCSNLMDDESFDFDGEASNNFKLPNIEWGYFMSYHDN